MASRFLTAALGATGLAGVASLAIGYHAGAPAGLLAACVGAAVGAALALRAPDAASGMRRQLTVAMLLFAAHAIALYTFGVLPDGPLPAGLQGTLAIAGLAACGFAAGRITPPLPRSPARTVRDSDADDTVELQLAETRSLPALPKPAPLRGLMIGGVAAVALFVLATLYWLEGSKQPAALAAADASEVTVAAAALPVMPEPESVAPPPPDPAPVEETPPTASTASTGAPVITPSNARRECMAQIESARLFLQIARSSPSQVGYAEATATQIDRLLKARPVGPRTLSRIAERMWDLRDAPERDAAWWSGQYARCESARSSGSWYVVRG